MGFMLYRQPSRSEQVAPSLVRNWMVSNEALSNRNHISIV